MADRRSPREYLGRGEGRGGTEDRPGAGRPGRRSRGRGQPRHLLGPEEGLRQGPGAATSRPSVPAIPSSRRPPPSTSGSCCRRPAITTPPAPPTRRRSSPATANGRTRRGHEPRAACWSRTETAPARAPAYERAARLRAPASTARGPRTTLGDILRRDRDFDRRPGRVPSYALSSGQLPRPAFPLVTSSALRPPAARGPPTAPWAALRQAVDTGARPTMAGLAACLLGDLLSATAGRPRRGPGCLPAGGRRRAAECHAAAVAYNLGQHAGGAGRRRGSAVGLSAGDRLGGPAVCRDGRLKLGTC